MPDQQPCDPQPQDLAAQDFMAHKGLGHVQPLDVEETKPGKQWTYYYLLPGNCELELLVTWLVDACEWDIFVQEYRRPQLD